MVPDGLIEHLKGLSAILQVNTPKAEEWAIMSVGRFGDLAYAENT